MQCIKHFKTSPLIATMFLATGLLAGALTSASAQVTVNGTSVFEGVVASTCVIGPTGTPGVMTASADMQTLSSKNGGLATPSTMSLVTTGGVTVSISPNVTGVSLAPGDTGTIAWTPTFAVAGAHPSADGTGNRTLTGAGVDTLTIHLQGQKSGSNIFSMGTYTATVTLTCETGS